MTVKKGFIFIPSKDDEMIIPEENFYELVIAFPEEPVIDYKKTFVQLKEVNSGENRKCWITSKLPTEENFINKLLKSRWFISFILLLAIFGFWKFGSFIYYFFKPSKYGYANLKLNP